MIGSREVRARERLARDRLAERADRDADPEWQAIQAARRAHLDAQAAEQREQQEHKRQAQGASALAVVATLAERLGDEWVSIAQQMRRVRQIEFWDAIDRTIEAGAAAEREQARAEKEAASEAARIANDAAVAAAREQAIATRAARLERDRQRAAKGKARNTPSTEPASA